MNSSPLNPRGARAWATPSEGRELPTVLVIDDLFGRTVRGGRNVERENLCAQYLIRDASGDENARSSGQTVVKPIARACFMRGQHPVAAIPGDIVENDLAIAVATAGKGYGVVAADGAERFRPWALVLIDLCFYTGRVSAASHERQAGMPEGREGDDQPQGYFGLRLLEALRVHFPEVPLIVFSSKPREDVNLRLSEAGALAFIARDDPNGPEVLRATLWQHGLMPDASGLLAGSSLGHLKLLRSARRACLHRRNVLLLGERGTGKDLFARFINSTATTERREDRCPLVAVNSAVFSQDLAGAELFGIEHKTATGVAGRKGFIEQADGGDLFLDEIGDMSPAVQATLLRVIQDKWVTPIGARDGRAIDVRFLSATNRDLFDPATGFREDLLDRLGDGAIIKLLPLRDRAEDIPELAQRFVSECEAALGLPRRRRLLDDTLAVLRDHAWPGNVRELQSALFAAVANYPDMDFVVPAHLRLGHEPELPRSSGAPTRVPDVALSPAVGADVNSAPVVASIDAIKFDASSVLQWSGKAGEVGLAVARLWARYLLAAISATKRVTNKVPHGEVKPHPAVKLMTGNSALSAMQAADQIKRMLSPIAGELEGDLLIAYQASLRLRPPNRTKKSFHTDLSQSEPTE